MLMALLALPLSGQERPKTPASTPAASAVQLLVARNGDEVIVAWEIPAGLEIKGLDIYRNTHEHTSGRNRVDYVRPSPALYRDKVPDPGVAYWYWLKLVLSNGDKVNIGPVRTPDAAVWTP